jgi:hypothetical protein
MKRVLLLFALPLALLTACGGGDTLSIGAVAQAADKTAAQKSAKFDMSMQMTLPGVEQQVRLFATGAVDYANEAARVDMDFGELANAMGQSGGAEMKMSMIFDSPMMYMKLPETAMQGGDAPPTPWVSIDLTKATGVDLGQLDQFSRNPADQLEMLRAASDKVEKRGEKEIRGVQTTHFHATLNMRKALDEGLKALREKDREKTKRALDAIVKQTGLDTLPVDVFLDEDGVLRRMVMDMEMAAGEGGEKMRMVMTMDMFDFGAEVDVTAPPASQVTDVTEQMAAQMKQGG